MKDTEAGNNFYDKYNPLIRSIVSRILISAKQAGDIDDCVNGVFLELMEKLRQYNETRGSMAAFVAIVARSAAIDYCRSNARKPGELVGDENLDFLAEPLSFEEGVEFKLLVESILERLNKRERILFTMKYILFYTSEEIASNLKIKRGTVDMRVKRLKDKIKSFLTKGGVIL
ncbi:MAG: sigma-70 family RNA polymerase sigma factor [Oscillospiraceae bacterium]|nr:sigma-70 family RNA polymerase sigma factor [Oscillospiraceae bacterium]